jgi:uncharacterized caspase-like protein
LTSKFALVIANTEYQDASFAKLTAPSRDAEEFAQVLRDAELAAFDDVQILLNEGEGKTRRSIARFFAERKPADLLLLYFSGHGVRNDQGQLFLAANDTEIAILEATGIPAEFVTYTMNNSRSQRQLLILDCCNSGAFAHGSKSVSAVGKSMGIASAFEGSGFGRVVLTATDATQYAWEGDKVIGDTQKSVFTHFLIEGLKGEADRNGDGRIHVDELYDYAYEQVVHRTPKQTPGKWSYKQQGDMILRENLKPRDVKPVPLPSDLLDLLSHPNSGVRKVGIQDLVSLLEGKHLGLSRAAEEKLREIAENDDSLTLRKAASDTLIGHGITLEQPVETPNESPVLAKPAPVEVLKQAHREARKIEKSAPTTTSPMKNSELVTEHTDVLREKTPRTLPARKSSAFSLNFRFMGLVVGGVLIISLLIWGGSKLFLNLPTTPSEPTLTSQPEQSNTPSPIATSITPMSDQVTVVNVPIVETNPDSNSGPYTLTINTPQLAGSDDPRVEVFNQRLNDLISDEVESYRQDFKQLTVTPDSNGSTLEVTYLLVSRINNIWSFKFDFSFYYDMAAHPGLKSITLNYDLDQGRELALSDLFLLNSNYLEEISNHCLNQLSEQFGSDYFPEGANPTEENYRNWNITPDGLLITFDEYQVAPYAAGPQEIVLPYSELTSVINSQGPLSVVLH